MELVELLYKIKKNLLPSRISSEDYTNYLKRHGINIGKGTFFFDPKSTTIDIQRPWMLKIGEYCKITQNVTILCHDYSRSVLRRAYGEVIGEAVDTRIGDNVFIGINSVVCMGAQIGNNVIIGAGSVVTGKIPDNSVAAGNPARIICSLDEYYLKRKSKTLDEAKNYTQKFYAMYDRYPTPAEMGPFWQLFMPRDVVALRKEYIFTKLSGDEETEVIDAFLKTSACFNSYADFIANSNK